jgi:hypothetical protein
MPDDVLPVQSRRVERVKRAQTMQHVIAAILLGQAAIGHLRAPHNAELVLPILELAASAALILSAIREQVRHARGFAHEKVAWLEIAGAAMAFVEAIKRLIEPHHHLSFRIVSFIPPVMLLLFGVFDLRLRSIRYLKVDDDGFAIKLRMLFPKKQVKWEHVRGFRIAGNKVAFALHSGATKTISLRDVKEREQALRWLAGHLNRREIPELPAA